VHRSLEQTAEEIARFSSDDAFRLIDMVNDWNSRRSRSAWDVVVENFKHPVTRHVLSWMGFAPFQPPSARARLCLTVWCG
jgi:hypothetical protein